ALIGVGNLGTAFLHYNFMKNNNTKIMMAFDADPSKSGTSIGGVPIYHIDELEEKINNVKVAILTIPANEADGITTKHVTYGIEGNQNFTAAIISGKDDIRVHHKYLA